MALPRNQHTSQQASRQSQSGRRRRHVFFKLGYAAMKMGCRPAACELATYLEHRTQRAAKNEYVQIGYGGRSWHHGRYISRPRGLAEEIGKTRAYTMEAVAELEAKGLLNVDGETITVRTKDRTWTQRRGSRDKSKGGVGIANRYRPAANLVRVQHDQAPRPLNEPEPPAPAPGEAPAPHWDGTDQWLLDRLTRRREAALAVPEPDP